MEKTERSKVWQMWKSGRTDLQYRIMLERIRRLEKQYDAVLQTLPAEQQDIICDYVALCEEMSWRLLEIACQTQE